MVKRSVSGGGRLLWPPRHDAKRNHGYEKITHGSRIGTPVARFVERRVVKMFCPTAMKRAPPRVRQKFMIAGLTLRSQQCPFERVYRALDRTRCCRNVVQATNGLSCDHSLLHTSAHTESIYSLKADPHGMASTDLKRGDQPSTDGHKQRRENHKWSVIAQTGDHNACNYRYYDKTEDHRDIPNTGFDGRHAFDSLKPDRNVVDY